jgi:hypothetical protein
MGPAGMAIFTAMLGAWVLFCGIGAYASIWLGRMSTDDVAIRAPRFDWPPWCLLPLRVLPLRLVSRWGVGILDFGQAGGASGSGAIGDLFAWALIRTPRLVLIEMNDERKPGRKTVHTLALALYTEGEAEELLSYLECRLGRPTQLEARRWWYGFRFPKQQQG